MASLFTRPDGGAARNFGRRRVCARRRLRWRAWRSFPRPHPRSRWPSGFIRRLERDRGPRGCRSTAARSSWEFSTRRSISPTQCSTRAPGLATIPSSYEWAARIHGAGPGITTRRIVAPLLWPHCLAGAILIFSISFRELVGSVLLRPPGDANSLDFHLARIRPGKSRPPAWRWGSLRLPSRCCRFR